MELLKAAVIGVGYLGRFHAQKYKMIDNVQLSAVCDKELSKVQAVATELGVPYFGDYKELRGIDIATIASTTSSHFEIAKWCLENGISVFVEKPVTVTSGEAKTLWEIAQTNKLKLQVGHIERFNPAVVHARKFITNPKYLECQRLHAFVPNRNLDVDVILDLMIHDLDLILSLVKSEVVEVKAIGTSVLTDKVDIANVRLEFANGTVANLSCSRVSVQAVRKLRIFESDKYISIDLGSNAMSIAIKAEDQKPGEFKLPKFEQFTAEKSDALLAETKSFVDAVMNNKIPQVTGEDGYKALIVAEKILSIIENQTKLN